MLGHNTYISSSCTILYHTLSQYATLCYVLVCCIFHVAMLCCYVMRCYAMPNGVLLFCYIMSRVTVCFDLLCNAMLQHGMVLCAVLCCVVISFYVILVHVILGYVRLDFILLCLLLHYTGCSIILLHYVMLCYVVYCCDFMVRFVMQSCTIRNISL